MGEGVATAANNVTNWAGTCYITPLIGAFLADSYLGRYWTISIFMMVYVLGLTLLTMTASVNGLRPECTNGIFCHPTQGQKGAVYAALYLIALGTGGIKPCVSSFGADQFDEADPREKKSKSSFFNWFYFSINIGALIAASVNQRPAGSPLTRIAQVVVSCVRKWRVHVPEDTSLLHELTDKESAIVGSRKMEHSNQFKFLDKACVETEEDKTVGLVNPWSLCTVTQVEELKSIVRLLPLWAGGIIFSTVYGQMSTMFVLQGNTLDPHIGPHFKIPAASLSIFDTLSVIVWVPFYDRILVPLVRRITGRERGFTQLTRMGIGLVISIFAMVAAGLLEVARFHIIHRDNLYDSREYIPMSIFWQVPQYFLVGAAEVFTFIGQLEFFYDQAPDAMRSMCSALSLTTVSLGMYLSSLLVTIVTNITARNGKLGWIPDNLNRGHLDYFFWLLAIMSFVNFLLYLLIAKWYNYKKMVDDLEETKLEDAYEKH
ncbi:Protein NRT1/ PTR FAMILY 8.1 [Rhynchospora pubera]|uniref:Protein NRT1/ PTR FAMILY 8.1 n=1 Tax=Rhynchospora pubera TaxID=906938 RepID=A0AAV8DM93_9POAL|nr:Protein NRT1/ PTR FAMILY 8.1 [Rhynchospora pubera]